MAINENNTKTIKRKATYEVKGEPIEITEKVRINMVNNQEIIDEKLEDENLERIYEQYRKKKGLLTPEQIRNIREKYGLSQRAFSRILGWGEITIHRYERGALQDRSHNDYLVLLQNPNNMKKLLEENKDRINQKDYLQIKNNIQNIMIKDIDKKIEENIEEKYFNEILDEYCGFTQFNYEKMVNMILFFASRINRLFKTKLMKLLFYSDFIHFHDYTLSITGFKYLKNHYGPTPIKHELLLGELSDKYITYKVDYIESPEECIIEEYETIKPLEKPNLSIFSKEEMNSINKVLKAFKFLTSEKISEYSHQEKAWKATKVKQLINYKHAKDMMLFK
jgi:putative zinc finger/helix-turn-helix YgiT family protein